MEGHEAVMAMMGLRKARRDAKVDALVRDIGSLDYASRLDALGDLAGVWVGSGAQALGLAGTVDNPRKLDALLAACHGADVVTPLAADLAATLADAERFAAELEAQGRGRDAADVAMMRLDVLAAYVERLDVGAMAAELGWPAADYAAASYVHEAARCFPGAEGLHTHMVIVREPVRAGLAAAR
jgi:hypothetical protein